MRADKKYSVWKWLQNCFAFSSKTISIFLHFGIKWSRYEKVDGEVLKSNVLLRSETYHPFLCGMALSCRCFTITKSETSGCVLYRNEIIDAEVSVKDIPFWMDEVNKYIEKIKPSDWVLYFAKSYHTKYSRLT